MEIKEVFHIVSALLYSFGCYYDWNYVVIPSEIHRMGEAFGFSGKLKFLTYWNAILQSVFFTLCILNDFIGSNENVPKKTPIIRKVKDLIMTALAFPLSLFVGLTFWGLYFVDRELIFPKAIGPYFPNWLNHLMHTSIMISIFLELYTSYRKYPTRKLGLSMLSFVMFTYLIWLHVIHYYTGMWVYPILEVLNFPLRIMFFISLLIMVILFYIIGENLNNFLWKKHLKSLKAK